MRSLKKEHIFFSLTSDTADNEEPKNLFLKIVFSKISQNSQENTCVEASFLIKMQAFLEKRLRHSRFTCKFCEIFNNTFFHRLSVGDCFCIITIYSKEPYNIVQCKQWKSCSNISKFSRQEITLI